MINYIQIVSKKRYSLPPICKLEKNARFVPISDWDGESIFPGRMEYFLFLNSSLVQLGLPTLEYNPTNDYDEYY